MCGTCMPTADGPRHRPYAWIGPPGPEMPRPTRWAKDGAYPRAPEEVRDTVAAVRPWQELAPWRAWRPAGAQRPPRGPHGRAPSRAASQAGDSAIRIPTSMTGVGVAMHRVSSIRPHPLLFHGPIELPLLVPPRGHYRPRGRPRPGCLRPRNRAPGQRGNGWRTRAAQAGACTVGFQTLPPAR